MKIIFPNHHRLHYQSLRISSLVLRVLAASCVIPSSLPPRKNLFILYHWRCVFLCKGLVCPLRPLMNKVIFFYCFSIALSSRQPPFCSFISCTPPSTHVVSLRYLCRHELLPCWPWSVWPCNALILKLILMKNQTCWLLSLPS